MVLNLITGFIEQSQRVIAVTHKPSDSEYKQMAFTTAIGMLVIGAIGFIISMTAAFARG